MAKRFNVRVYGLLIENNALLVSDEYIKSNKITKLPYGLKLSNFIDDFGRIRKLKAFMEIKQFA